MILCDSSLIQLLEAGYLTQPADMALVNPASIDIRVGNNAIVELPNGEFRTIDMHTVDKLLVHPGEFLLVETLERIVVPVHYALDLRLKSSAARQGWDHSLAFWFDPGWDGIGTMELHNRRRYGALELRYGQRIAQVIVHELDQPPLTPYQGRYQHATHVEGAK